MAVTESAAATPQTAAKVRMHCNYNPSDLTITVSTKTQQAQVEHHTAHARQYWLARSGGN